MRAVFVGQGRLCRTICSTTIVLALAPNELSTRLQHSHSRHDSIINPPICTICTIIRHQPVHCYHLPPTCYWNQQQLPRHLTRHSPSLLLKPGITYQQLLDLQHNFIFSLAISKCTSSQLPLNSHQPSPEPLTHHYCKFIIDWLIDMWSAWSWFAIFCFLDFFQFCE